MKKFNHVPGILAIVLTVFLVACQAPVTLTSWTDPANNASVKKVAVFGLLNKLEYIKPFEQSVTAYFNSKGLKAIGSLEFINPTLTYTIDQIKAKVDSLGADAVLVVDYKGTDKSQEYIPPTYTGGWGWGWPGGYWGGTVSGGYWTTNATANLNTRLFVKGNKSAVWTGDITVENPTSVSESATQIAQDIYADWVKHNLVAAPQK